MTAYVIVGNSAAGISAAETIRRLDPEGDITIVDVEKTPAYSRCLLPNYLGGTRSEDALRIRPRDFYQKLRLNTCFGYRVARVDVGEKVARLDNGARLKYDRLFISTGSSTFMPPVPGITGEGVYGLRTLEDAKKILAQAGQARRAVIIGGGFVGLEAAWALYRRGLEVTVVEKMPQILPQQFDACAAAILLREMQAEGIRFILGTGIKEIAAPGLWEKLTGKAGRGVILENGDRLKAELVIVATGTRANTGLVEGTGVKVNLGIVVDKYQSTGMEGVYAGGDVAETEDVVSGRIGLTPIWPNAVAQGRVAGYNMAGIPREYGGMIGMQNAVEFRDVPAIAVGLAQADGDGYEILKEYRPEHNLYKKIVLKDDIIVGLILVGDIRQAGVYSALMRKKAKVTRLKHRLLRPDFGYGQVLSA
ncbi:MAG: NAD(P)/FAD-dependent oxidoreductase [Clostridia bacterium]|nr:MAG: NAD(P)/FAD-dependent oxidoreductase [Clostridia bacterium]